MDLHLAQTGIDLISSAFAQDGPSAEQIKAATELLKSLSALPPAEDPICDGLCTLGKIGDFISAAGWPIVALIAIIVFRNRITKIKMGEHEIQLAEKLEQKKAEASKEVANRKGRPGSPSASEIARAESVEKLAGTADFAVFRKQAEDLAREYETTRASMLPGDQRTRRMEIIVAKMRVLGGALFPIRQEFMTSPSPGFRLLAIACMQVKPDYESLDWLAERVDAEKPFVGYHALVALRVAANDPLAHHYKDALKSALAKAESVRSSLRTDTDRIQTLNAFGATVKALDAVSGDKTPATGQA